MTDTLVDDLTARGLTKAQLTVLRQYQHTNDLHYMQGVKGAHELWRPLGLLDWHGEQYGTHFYSITDAGRAALASLSPPVTP